MSNARSIFTACRELRQCGITLHPTYGGALVVADGEKWSWAEGYILMWLNTRSYALDRSVLLRFRDACDHDVGLPPRSAHFRRLLVQNFGGLGEKRFDNYENFMWTT